MLPRKPNLSGAVFGLLAILLVTLVAGPVGTPVVRGQAGPLKVVTTISPIADLIKNVGGDRVQVTSLVPVGADLPGQRREVHRPADRTGQLHRAAGSNAAGRPAGAGHHP